MDLVRRLITGHQGMPVFRQLSVLVIALAAAIAAHTPSAVAATDYIEDVRIETDVWLTYDGEGGYTVHADAMLTWVNTGDPNPYCIKHNGEVVEENYDGDATSYTIHGIERSFGSEYNNDDDKALAIEAVLEVLLAFADAESWIGTWEVGLTCGTGSGAAGYWPPGPWLPPLPPWPDRGPVWVQGPIFPPLKRPPPGGGGPRPDPQYTSVLYARTLFSFPSRGMQVEFAVQYNSDAVSKDGPLSYGWTHSYNMYLEQVNPGKGSEDPYNFVAHLGLGSERFMKFDENDYDSPNPYLELEDINSGDQLRLRIKDAEYVFDWDTKRVVSLKAIKERVDGSHIYPDNSGPTLEFAYYDDGGDPDYAYRDGKLESITDSSGRTYTFVYWSTSDTGFAQYGREGMLKWIEHPENSSVHLAEFCYDDTEDNLENITDAEDQETVFDYYPLESGDNVYKRHALKEVDPSAGPSTFYFFKNLLEYDDPRTTSTENIPIVTYTDVTHGDSDDDPYGKVTVKRTVDIEWNQQMEIDEVKCTYREVIDAEGWTKTYEYGSEKGAEFAYPVVEETDGEGNTTCYTYDDHENRTRIVRTNTNETDYWLITLNKYHDGDPDDAKWHNVYATITRLTDEEPDQDYYDDLEDLLETDPDHRYDYDDWGRQILAVDSRGVEMHTEYAFEDGLTQGLLLGTWTEADSVRSNEISYTYIDGATQYEIDNRWLVKTRSEQLAPGEAELVTEYEYNGGLAGGEGNPTSVVLREGSGGAVKKTTTYTYGEELNLGAATAVTEEFYNPTRSRTTDYEYDKLNRVTKVARPAAESGKPRHSTETTYFWDNLVADVTSYYGSDVVGKTSNVYSSLTGWLEQEWQYKDPTDSTPTVAEGHLLTTYAYLDNGMLESVTSPNGQTTGDDSKTEFVYYENGREQKIRYYEKNGTAYDEESYTYFPDGQVDEWTNCRGKKTTYEYDQCNRLSKTTYPVGYVMLEYEAATGLVSSTMNAEGEETSYTYDDFGRQTKITVDPSGLAIETQTAYDDATGAVTATVNANGTRTEYEYDFLGRQTKTTLAKDDPDDETAIEAVYTDEGPVKTVTHLMNLSTADDDSTTTYEYDVFGRPVQVTDALDQDTVYTYDDYDIDTDPSYVFSFRRETVTDRREKVTYSDYDIFGRLEKTTRVMGVDDDDPGRPPNDPEDIVTRYDYDEDGNRVSVTDAEGIITEFEYDHRDRLVLTRYASGQPLESTVELELDMNGNVITQVDQLGIDTHYTYNDADRLVTMTYKDGTTVELTRDTMGRVTAYQDQEGRVTSLEYDDAGRLINTTGPDGESIVLTLDDQGNVTTHRDQELNETDYGYDALDRLTSATYEDSTVVARTYDPAGRLKTISNQYLPPATPDVTAYDYDKLGQLKETTYADGNTEEFEYDANGNLETRKLRCSPSKLEPEYINYTYDDADRLTDVTYPDGSTIKYAYDQMSRMTEATVKDDQQLQLSKGARTYDALGRLTHETQELGTGTGKTVSYPEYNLAGSLKEMTYPENSMTLEFDYDDVYNLTSIVDTNEPNDPVAEYQYNKAYQPTRLGLRNGSYVNYAYDAMGRLALLVNKRPGGATLSSYLFERNKVGCPTQLTYHDGRFRIYQYDELYRVTREGHWTPQQATLLWHDYDYDAAGNRDWKRYDSSTGPLLDYTYNSMNQLTDLEGDTGNRADVAGTVSDDNLSSVTVYNADDPGAEFEAQLRQQLFIARAVELEEGDNDLYALALDKASNEKRYPENESEYHTVTLDSSVDLDHVYNDRGCLTEIVEGAATLVEYVYDYENRLIKVVEDPNGTPVTLAEYQYDGLGRRVWSNVGGVETRFIYSGDDVVQEYEYDSGWVPAAEYVHGIGVDEPLRLERGGQTYYYHYDGYGSVSELTDSSGALSQAYEYDAWGVATMYDPDHPSRNPYMYTGQRWDESIGLYYYRARHYAPQLGRFLQPDPAGYIDGVNLYAYAVSAPTTHIDPWGTDAYGIETGTPVVFRPRTWIGRTIAAFTGGTVSHCGIVWENNTIVHAVAGGIVVEPFTQDLYEYLEKALPVKDLETVKTNVKKLLSGEHIAYDTSGLIRETVGEGHKAKEEYEARTGEQYNCMVCSAFVVGVLPEQMKEWIMTAYGPFVTPAELMQALSGEPSTIHQIVLGDKPFIRIYIVGADGILHKIELHGPTVEWFIRSAIITALERATNDRLEQIRRRLGNVGSMLRRSLEAIPWGAKPDASRFEFDPGTHFHEWGGVSVWGNGYDFDDDFILDLDKVKVPSRSLWTN